MVWGRDFYDNGVYDDENDVLFSVTVILNDIVSFSPPLLPRDDVAPSHLGDVVSDAIRQAFPVSVHVPSAVSAWLTPFPSFSGVCPLPR